MSPELPIVLLVDDEPSVLDGLRRQLRGSAVVHTAGSAAEGLRLLAEHDVHVIVSDMRMPGLDGADFLAVAGRRRPDATRLVLSGGCDVAAALRAVNQGRVARFLTKPCAPDELRQAIAQGAEDQRLRRAERSLLEETLKGAVAALLDALALADPALFARAVRIGRLVKRLALALEDPAWSLQVAGMLSQIGSLGLPGSVSAALASGAKLAPADEAMVGRIPAVGVQMLAGIPRLDAVRDAIRWQRERFDGGGARDGAPHGTALPLGARLLRVAVDVDALTARGLTGSEVLATLAEDSGAYDPVVLRALSGVLDAEARSGTVSRRIRVCEAVPGMVIDEELRTTEGHLLAGRGTTITDPMLERLTNHLRHGRLSDRLVVRTS